MGSEEFHTRIVIVGGGTAGWMAAAILAPLRADGYSITLVESEEIGTVGVGEATIPQINLFNKAVGLDEDEFVRATSGTFKLGIEFVDWQRRGTRYMHAFGDVGRDIGLVAFQHYWHRGRELGFARDLQHYALNELAARAGKMQRGRLRTTDKLGPMPYAYHFDASLYAAFLRRHSGEQRVCRIEGKIVEVLRGSESGQVDGVRLAGGEVVEGDLFLDCSGFRALLIEGALSSGFEDWSRWLPCDRAFAVPCELGGDGLTPYTRATARDAGWQWRIPLQHRIGNGHVYSSAFTDDERAASTLVENLDGKALAEPRQLRFTAGRRRTFWKDNVVALGLAGGFLEPLESTSIHLVQSGLQRLLRLLPKGRPNPALAVEFNRQSVLEYERIRDFLILHYKATERDDTDFWRYCASMDVPDSLAERIELFRETGHIVRRDDELFTEVGWLQVLVGQGVLPAKHHPLADSIRAEDLAAYLETWNALLEREVRQMPLHEDIIARQCAARAA